MKFNKKGLSAVVANVLIILLVLAAVAIIWAVIRPTVEGAGDQISSDCFSLLVSPESCVIVDSLCVGGADDGVACAGNSDCDSNVCTEFAEVRIDVSRNPGAGDLSGIRFIVTGALSKVVSDTNANSGSLPNELETSRFVFSTFPPSGPLDGIVAGDNVDIAAVIGAQQTICNPSGSPVICVDAS